jgi:maltose O-acetyltransferase
VPRPHVVFWLRLLQALDRLRLRWLLWRHPGLEIAPGASTNLAWARYDLAPGSRLVIAPGVVTERERGALRFTLAAGARVEIGPDTWLRTALGPVHLVAFEGGRIQLGPECFLNGCHLSAKRELRLGRRAWIGPGSRVFDADQHDFDAERPERIEPVSIGNHVWIASDVTVLRGVSIGDHSVIGARSVVIADVDAHTVAVGAPARAVGSVGDRSQTR